MYLTCIYLAKGPSYSVARNFTVPQAFNVQLCIEKRQFLQDNKQAERVETFESLLSINNTTC